MDRLERERGAVAEAQSRAESQRAHADEALRRVDTSRSNAENALRRAEAQQALAQEALKRADVERDAAMQALAQLEAERAAAESARVQAEAAVTQERTLQAHVERQREAAAEAMRRCGARVVPGAPPAKPPLGKVVAGLPAGCWARGLGPRTRLGSISSRTRRRRAINLASF
jgi:chromosome segregation ATPase